MQEMLLEEVANSEFANFLAQKHSEGTILLTCNLLRRFGLGRNNNFSRTSFG